MSGRTLALAWIAAAISFPLTLPGESPRPAQSPQASAAPTAPSAVAIIAGESISTAEFDTYFTQYAQRLGGRLDAMPAEDQAGFRQSLLNQLVEEKLIRIASSQEPVDEKKLSEALDAAIAKYGSRESWQADLARSHQSEAAFEAQIKERLQRDAWLARTLEALPAPSEETLKAFYEQHLGAFNPPGQIRASHLMWVVPSDAATADVEEKRRAAAAFAAQARTAGSDFDALCQQHKGRGVVAGDLGFKSPQQMPVAVAKALGNLSVGGISDPVRTDLGWQVFKVTETTTPEPKEFRNVRPRIEAAYRREQRAERWQQLITTLRTQYAVETFPLPAPATNPTESTQH